jgi:hypothetical protein
MLDSSFLNVCVCVIYETWFSLSGMILTTSMSSGMSLFHAVAFVMLFCLKRCTFMILSHVLGV